MEGVIAPFCTRVNPRDAGWLWSDLPFELAVEEELEDALGGQAPVEQLVHGVADRHVDPERLREGLDALRVDDPLGHLAELGLDVIQRPAPAECVADPVVA